MFIGVQSSAKHIPGWIESLSLIIRRIYHSMGYGILYAAVLVLNLGLILWLVKDKGEPKPIELFFMLEVAVTVALLLEIAYTLKMQGFKAWVKDLSNWFDFFIAVICVLSLGAFAVGEELQGEVAVGVASARYTAQALRLGALLRHARRKNPQGIAEFEQVRFNVDFETTDQTNDVPGSSNRGPSSPTLSTYYGRGRAFAASPIFQNPKAKRAIIIPLENNRSPLKDIESDMLESKRESEGANRGDIESQNSIDQENQPLL